MTLAEFHQAYGGFVAFHTGRPESSITADEFYDWISDPDDPYLR